MTLIKILILLGTTLSVFAEDNYVDSLTLSKIKKLVQKEEEVALAYKKYILEKGIYPSTITTMRNDNYLPKGFEIINPFGKEITLILDDNNTTSNKKDDKHKIKGFQTSDPILKSNLYDYYYSNKFRIYTKAPLSVKNSNVEIILSSKEKFIYENSANITTVESNAKAATSGKYYLDTNGVLHWYQSGSYKFSMDKDLIVDSSVALFEADGKTVTDEFKTMAGAVIFAGQNIIHKESGGAKEYLGVDENTIVNKNPEITVTTDKGLIQFGKQSGGMIINGDIYTWGNNKNRVTSINIDAYKKGSNVDGSKKPVIVTLTPIRAKIYDTEKYVQETNDSTNRASCKSPIGTGTLSCKYSTTDCISPTGSGTILCKDIGNKFYEQNYFSSPLRPRFVDLFSDTTHGTCAISTNGELFCGGTSLGSNYTFGNNFTHVDTTRSGEMLYRSTYFDGSTDSRKAKKIFANNQLWLILSKDGDIYRWGYEDANKNGFSGNGNSRFNRNSIDTTKVPEKIVISTAKFTDITYTFADGYKKIAALSNTGEIYIWGMDSSNSDSYDCTETWDSVSFNLCQPTKVTKDNSTLTSNMNFQSIKGGLRAFIALGNDGKYYKIEQPLNKKIQVTEIKDGTTVLPTDTFSIDLTSNGTLVYVNSSNQLISSYFNTASFDTTFRNTINSMLWKSIKVLEDTNNSMCGLNTDNQMYCWGVQSYTDSLVDEKNTFMLPVFNTNLFDSTKDYLVVEGGAGTNPTTMTSGSWLDSSSKFFVKYPTYIGGFNYEVIFK